MSERTHIPVMLEETLAALDPRTDGSYVDGTFGAGGHTRALLRGLGAKGRLLVIDKDPVAIKQALELASHDPRVVVYHGSFADVGECVPRLLGGSMRGILLDLGVSFRQLDEPDRGFSFQQDGPLDMRMNTAVGDTAAAWLARVDLAELASVLQRFGEERQAWRIARAIVAARADQPIDTTLRLADIVSAAIPRRGAKIHPATRTFQAIRMEVNRELADLEQALAAIPPLLAPGGRLVTLSFHSLEDRLVKQFMRHQAGMDVDPRLGDEVPAPMRLVRSPKKPQATELENNRRARSARLRVAERTEAPLLARPSSRAIGVRTRLGTRKRERWSRRGARVPRMDGLNACFA